MNTLIERIMAVAGDMPNRDAHRRYLGTLSEQALKDRLATLTGQYREPAKVEFWTTEKRKLQTTV